MVGVVSIGADLASPAGFALKTGRPVISNHLESEERFRTPEILVRHGIRRAMNVILQGDGQPFGVLEVDSRSEDEFVEHDLAFLQGAANILGMAIERERHERNLKAALERQQFLVKEMNHRVKNSLALVVGMLRLQARENSEPEFTQQLEDATLRVGAIARVHEQLYQSADVERFDVGRYIEAICKDLGASFAQCEIHVQAQAGIMISTDRAISSALIVNELVSNAAKHAYQGQGAGNVWVNVAATGVDSFSIAIRDEGDGLPEGSQFGEGKGLGARMVRALAEQLNASLEVVAHASRRRIRRHRPARPIDARHHCSRVVVETVEQAAAADREWARQPRRRTSLSTDRRYIGPPSRPLRGATAALRRSVSSPSFAVFAKFCPALDERPSPLLPASPRTQPHPTGSDDSSSRDEREHLYAV